jgi:hypothetical protein
LQLLKALKIWKECQRIQKYGKDIIQARKELGKLGIPECDQDIKDLEKTYSDDAIDNVF